MKQLSLFETHTNTKHTPKHWVLYVDGASRNNPGKAGAGIHIIADDQTVCKEGYYLGIKTNNQAEYLALLIGLFILQRHVKSGDVVRIISDSELLVKQMCGEYRVRHKELIPLHALASRLVTAFNADVLHVLREDNRVADEMANNGIDKQRKVPDEFVSIFNEHAISL